MKSTTKINFSFGSRMVRNNGNALLVLLLLACAATCNARATACDIPVFRYALERWTAEKYQIVVFHRGELDPSEVEIVNALKQTASENGGEANFTVRVADLDGTVDEATQALWRPRESNELPRIVVAYPAGRLSDRVGRRPIALTAGLLGALAIALIFLSQQNFTLIMLCGGLVGIAFGAFMSSNWALATDLVPKGEEARYLGLTNLATAGGAALARLIGPLIDFGNSQSPNLGYSIMFLACFIYFVVGSLLLLKIKRR